MSDTGCTIPPKPYGCHNHPPYRSHMTVQDGWFNMDNLRVPRIKIISVAVPPRCEYTHSPQGAADQRCEGCNYRR